MIRRIKRLLIIGLLFLPSLGFCDEFKKIRIDRFEGGQNSADLASIIDPVQGVLYKNTVLNKRGQLFKRKGQSLFASDVSDTAFTGIGVFEPDPNTSYIMAASGISILRAAASGGWIIVNDASPLTAGYDTEFIQANKLLFILNGANYTSFYDGSVFTIGSSASVTSGGITTSSPPIATTAEWLRNYLFTAGEPANNDWVKFSENLEPMLFVATDLFRVNTGDGQKVVKLESFKLNELVIYKTKSIFILDISGVIPLTNWTLQPITTSIGCAAKRSVVNIGNDHWFLSSEPFAVRSLSRTSFDKLTTDTVSQPIQDIFDGTGDTILNTTQVSKSAAVLFDNKYILAIPVGTSVINNFVVVYDFITKSWYTIDGWFPAAWAVWNNNLYYTDALDGRVIRCFDSNYADIASGPIVTATSEPTVAINYDYISKAFDFENPENYKRLDALEVEFEATGNFNVDVYVNLDSAGWQSAGSINLADDTPVLPNTLPIALTSKNIARKTFQLQQYGEFKKIQIRFIQNVYGAKCNLHSYTIFSFLRPWRRE